MVLAILELCRPLNCLITFASVLLGGWLGIHAITEPLLWAALSAVFITGGGNALNDLCGVAEDQINKPHRPIPSGRLSRKTASTQTTLLLLAGLALSLLLSSSALAIALTAIISLFLYNLYLKRVPLVGNLIVSALGGLAFLYGGATVENFSAPLLIAAFAFLFHLGREILKDLEDSAGDRYFSGGTVPIAWGENVARTITSIIFVLLIVLTPMPAVYSTYGQPYLILIILLDLLLLYVLIRLWQTNEPQKLGFLSALLKAGMLLGLSAFLFAQT